MVSACQQMGDLFGKALTILATEEGYDVPDPLRVFWRKFGGADAQATEELSRVWAVEARILELGQVY